MANLTIAGLSPKTPAFTDLVPAADPVTGLAGKLTIAQLHGIEPVNDTITGNWLYNFYYNVVTKSGFMVNGAMVVPQGVCVRAFNYTETARLSGGVTSITHNNIGMILGNYTPTMPSCASYSFPVLQFLGSSGSLGGSTITSLSAPELIYLGSWPALLSSWQVSTFTLPKLKIIASGTSFINGGTTPVTSISFPELKYSGVSNTFIFNCLSLTSLNMPLLESCVGLVISTNTVLPTISLPALQSVRGNCNLAALPALSTLNLPALTEIGQILTISGLTVITTISLPALQTVGFRALVYTNGYITVSSCGSLTSFSIPAITAMGSNAGTSVLFINGTAALSSFTLGSTLLRVEGNWTMTSCALNQASVDEILVRLAALDGTGGTTAYSSKTVTITGTSSTPSATGLAAKSTLVARGCTVTHN